MTVRDHIPLEQGLRRVCPCSLKATIEGQRPYSIRTRIKTHTMQQNTERNLCQRPYSIRTRIKTRLPRASRSQTQRQRPYSIRTRIKTIALLYSRLAARSVRDHIPLEQGLRHVYLKKITLRQCCQRPYSIRTRIKTLLTLTFLKLCKKSETIFH